MRRNDEDKGQPCVSANLQLLQDAIDSSRKHSPDLLHLFTEYEILQSYFSNEDKATGPLGQVNWNSPDLADPHCLQLGLEPRTGPIAYADLTNDGFKDAIVTFSCEVSTGGYPEYVRLFDGGSPASGVRALGDVSLDSSAVQLDRAITIERLYASPRGVLVVYSGRSTEDDFVTVVVITEYRWQDGRLQRMN